MTDHEFKPKLGRIRGGSRSKALPYASDVLDQLDKSAGRPLRPTGNRLRHGQQRGLASGALAASGLVAPAAAPSSRRAIPLRWRPAHCATSCAMASRPMGNPVGSTMTRDEADDPTSCAR
jgi:hypothetical protein